MAYKLLADTRALKALISTASDLLPVSRTIHQIAEESKRMLDESNRTPAAAPPGAAQRFLEQNGVDTGRLDPSAYEFTRVEGDEAPSPPLGIKENLEAILTNHENLVMDEVIDEANQRIFDDFEVLLFKEFRREHDEWRTKELEKHVHGLDSVYGHGPAAAAGYAGAAAMDTTSGQPSRGRSKRSVAFASALKSLWEERARGGAAGGGGEHGSMAGSLLTKWKDVAEKPEHLETDDSSRKLANCWKLLQSISDAAGVQPQRSTDTAADAERRLSMLRGTTAHLGRQQQKALEVEISRHEAAAARGNYPGLQFVAAAKVRLDQRLDQRVDAEKLSTQRVHLFHEGRPVSETPLWRTVYWCLRCGDVAAAFGLMDTGRKDPAHSATSWQALYELAKQLGELDVVRPAGSLVATAGGLLPLGMRSTQDLAGAIAAARDEYWAPQQPPRDKWMNAVYSVLAAPQPEAKLDDLLELRPGQMTIEDWLWHRMWMVRVQLSEGPAGMPASSAPLDDLQRLVFEQWGEAHFNQGGQTPLLFVSVLLHSLQFERALEFLYRQSQYTDEAVHLALALEHAGLLPHWRGHKAILERHADGLVHEDALSVLHYLFLLDGFVPSGETERLAVDTLVDANKVDVLTKDPTALAFLNKPTLRRLRVEAACKLHRKQRTPAEQRTPAGRMQALELLFVAEAYDELAQLLIEMLCDALLGSPVANPILGEQGGAAFGPGGPVAPDPTTEELALKLREDARDFLQTPGFKDAAETQHQARMLELVLQVAEVQCELHPVHITLALHASAHHGAPLSPQVQYAAAEWRKERAGADPQRARRELTKTLDKLEQLGLLLPSQPSEVDAAQADFRLLSSQVQRLTPPLILSAMEATHAKFVILRGSRWDYRAPSAGDADLARELGRLRDRAEALVGFAAVTCLGQHLNVGNAAMPQRASQQLATWLAEIS